MKITRVRNAQTSDIVNLSVDEFNTILNGSRKKDGYGISQLTRQLKKKRDSFFFVSEEKRGHSHIYKAAEDAGIKITVRRNKDNDGNLGYSVLCLGPA